MNDFHAAPVKWGEFLAQFQTLELGRKLQEAVAVKDTEQAMELAQEFLSPWIWERADDDDGPVTISFHGLGVVASLYPRIQQKLDQPQRLALEELIAPFAGQWISTLTLRRPAVDLPPEMRLLRYGALSVAIPPEQCQNITSALEGTSCTSALTAALAGEEDAEAFQSMVRLLATLLSEASQQKCGVISVFEV